MRTAIRGVLAAMLLAGLSGCPNNNNGGGGGGKGGGGVGGGIGGGGGGGGGVGVGGGGVGGGSGGGTGGGGGGGGPSAFCASFETSYCAYGVRCGFVADAGESDCVTFVKGDVCDPLIHAVSKGYQTFDGTQAQACLDAVAAAACSDPDPFNSNTACSGLVHPAALPGQTCEQAGDCLDAGTSCGGTGCGRTCAAPGPLGAPCPCNAGLRCDTTTSLCANGLPAGSSCDPFGDPVCDLTSYCDSTSHMCTALPTAGQNCVFSFPQCAPTLYCSGTTCQPQGAFDAGCTDTNGCLSGLFCNFGSANPTCQPLSGVDGGCTLGSDCQSGLYCTLTDHCMPAGGQGQPCTGGVVGDCLGNLVCDSVALTCQFQGTVVTMGNPCTGTTLQCALGLSCKGVMPNADGGLGGTVGTCQAAMLGDDCGYQGAGCPLHSYCNFLSDGGTALCTAPVVGTPCESNNECLATQYCGGAFPNGTCATLLSTGDSCDLYNSGCVKPVACLELADGGGQCSLLAGLNSPCVSTDSCLFPYACQNGVCVQAGHSGQPCYQSLCFDGACDPDAGTCTGSSTPAGGQCDHALQCASDVCIGTCLPTCP